MTDPPKRRRRKDARPGELIEAGLQEFAAKGYAATRLGDVAKRAGVSRATIYRYFDDKEALFVATVRSRLPAFFEHLDVLLDSYEGTTFDLVTMMLDQMYDQQRRQDLSVLIKILISEGQQFPALVELYYRETVSKGMAFMERIVARGVERGEIRADHAELLPMVMVAPGVMAMFWQMTFERQRHLDREAYRKAHLDLLFNGAFIAPDPSRKGKP